MSTHHLSSLKWNEEGELSPQDTWNLVTMLTKAEDLVSPMASPASKQQKRIEKKRHTDRVNQFVADMTLESVLQPEEGDDNALDNVTIGEASDYSRPWDFFACMQE